MRELLGETHSLCPDCLKRIPATKVVEDNDVYLEKRCPEHGEFKVLLWRDAELYKKWGQGEEAPGPQRRLTATNQGCPYDCGLCPNHKAETCTVLMEITQRCDIDCPVCFASANKGAPYHPDLDGIKRMYETILSAGGPYPLQLSGGEPTLRDDLPQIIALGKGMGFYHIQINTHGIRLARDKEYLQALKESGADLIYLQFDGVSDDVYRYTRGANLFKLKQQAIENCAEVKMGVTLVPTLIPGVNDHQIGDMVQFAKEWVPVVKGIHFQPISYFGRYPHQPKDEDRITIPDVLKALEAQTDGEVKLKDFVPRRRRDSHCGFSAFYVLMEEGRLLATTKFEHRVSPIVGAGYVHPKESPAEHVRRFIRERARFIEPGQFGAIPGQSFFERAKTHYLSISGMPFQDVWNVDLQRLQGCCIHVVTQDGRLIPFCSFYLTSSKGERLHRNIDTFAHFLP